MIEDGYPIIEESKWKAVPGAQAGALILDYPIKERPKYWACHCLQCGNPYVEKRIDNLKIGAIGGKVYASGRRCNGTRSCGCKQKKQFVKANTQGLINEDLTGQVLNGWRLIEKTFMKDSNRSFKYLVQSIVHPECYDVLSIRHLKDGYVAQSNLAKQDYLTTQKKYIEDKPHFSKNEENILNLCKANNIHGKWQFKFEQCKDKLPLPFDFFIEDKYIIEYDGEQHFKKISLFDKDEDSFLIRRAHDLIKNKYCFDNNIPLIRIPYDAKYTIDDLKLETTRFLLTQENEEEYYNSRGVENVTNNSRI